MLKQQPDVPVTQRTGKKKKKDLHSPEQPCEQSCKSKKKK